MRAAAIPREGRAWKAAPPRRPPAGARSTRPTVAEAFRITAEQQPDHVALRNRDDSIAITWGEVRERVDALAGGLAKLGVGPGDTVALMFGNRPEFHIADLAAMMLGAVPFSIYQTYTPEQIQYLISDSGARVAILEQAYLDRMLEARQELPDLEHVIVVDGEAPDGVTALADVEGSNPGFDVEASWRAIEPDDLLTLIYTSGTTGPPKGVQLSHHNMMSVIQSVEEIIGLPMGMRVISWLPSAHIAERNAHHYIPIVFAGTITCCENPREVMRYLPEVRPNWFFAVPRIWEKLKAGLETMLHAQPEEQRARMERALDAAREKVRLEQAGEAVPAELAEEVATADEEMFAGLRKHARPRRGDHDQRRRRADAGRGARVLPRHRPRAGRALGHVRDDRRGHLQPARHVKIGTVGPAAPGCEIKLAEDGEVLIRGGCVMVGYRNLPEKTAEALDGDGWLHTGDIGEIDDDGFLKIVDRKKELIINAAGKNMSPANIEAELKTATPLIGQACAIGDDRPYNTALIVLDADFAPQWASQQGIEDTSLEALADDERVRAAVQEGVDAANEHLARVEQIKKFTIVAGRLAARRRRADADDEAQAQADRREVRGGDRAHVREVSLPA